MSDIEFTATHTICITHHDGSVETEQVEVFEGLAYTSAEWEGCLPSDWEIVDGKWLFQGRPLDCREYYVVSLVDGEIVDSKWM